MSSTSPPVLPQSPSPAEQPDQLDAIARDVIMVWVLTVIGGFFVGIAIGREQDPQRFMSAVAASNILLGTVAFTISGCLAPAGRWRHLAFVALGSWVTSLVNVAFFGVTVRQWIAGGILLAGLMGIGGAISYAFKSDKRSSA